MSGPKKKEVDEQINAKIQRQFDLVFDQLSDKEKISKKNNSTTLNFNSNEQSQLKEDILDNNAQKKSTDEPSLPSLDFDFEDSESVGIDSSPLSMMTTVPAKAQNLTIPSGPVDNNELEFNLDFENDIPNFTEGKEEIKEEIKESSFNSVGFKDTGDDDYGLQNNELDTMFDEAILESKNTIPESTKKTVLYNTSNEISDETKNERKEIDDLDSFELEELNGTNSLDELMSTEEARANIESSIKNILGPKNPDATQEFDLFGLEKSDGLKKEVVQIEDFNTGEFDLDSVEFSDTEGITESKRSKELNEEKTKVYNKKLSDISSPTATPSHFINEDESGRVLATIRQLREEREELLNQMKLLKTNGRELEQDNLTLKAALDESKIEISILRKRHMADFEDVKYRLALNEEKKQLALEQARQAIAQRDKLEQRIRIDFNQVKLREKELETKLEILTIDVESQIQGRDQKILELRRKIDSLEFNMENVSIREHKLLTDKHKLEDKLNKLMKTLRHSIKNIEDDIDQATEGSQDNGQGIRQIVPHRSGKA